MTFPSLTVRAPIQSSQTSNDRQSFTSSTQEEAPPRRLRRSHTNLHQLTPEQLRSLRSIQDSTVEDEDPPGR